MVPQQKFNQYTAGLNRTARNTSKASYSFSKRKKNQAYSTQAYRDRQITILV